MVRDGKNISILIISGVTPKRSERDKKTDSHCFWKRVIKLLFYKAKMKILFHLSFIRCSSHQATLSISFRKHQSTQQCPRFSCLSEQNLKYRKKWEEFEIPARGNNVAV